MSSWTAIMQEKDRSEERGEKVPTSAELNRVKKTRKERLGGKKRQFEKRGGRSKNESVHTMIAGRERMLG